MARLAARLERARPESWAYEAPVKLVMPVLTLMLVDVGYVARMTRASMAEVMASAYVRTAVLKGCPTGA